MTVGFVIIIDIHFYFCKILWSGRLIICVVYLCNINITAVFYVLDSYFITVKDGELQVSCLLVILLWLYVIWTWLRPSQWNWLHWYPKRSVLFQILYQTCAWCKFLHCYIYLNCQVRIMHRLGHSLFLHWAQKCLKIGLVSFDNMPDHWTVIILSPLCYGLQ